MQKISLLKQISSASSSSWWSWHLILSRSVLLYFSKSLCLLWNLLWINFSLMRPVFSLFSPITRMRSLLLLLVLLSFHPLRMARNTANTVISRNIFYLNVLLSNVSIVTRLVTFFTTALLNPLSPVNQAFSQSLLITLLLLLLKSHPQIPFILCFG